MTAVSVVPSPCSGVCRIDEQSGHCVGCLRTIDEIVGWASATDETRREVWQALHLRREALGRLPP